MRKLYIVDLSSNNLTKKIYDSDVIYINRGNVSLINSKIINIKDLTKNYFEKKEYLKVLNLKINKESDFFINELEVFNNRNDKNINISKILNYLKIQYYINNKSKKYKLHCITDNKFTTDIVSQISKKFIINETENNSQNFFITKNILFNNIKFLFKTFAILVLAKLFTQNKFHC